MKVLVVEDDARLADTLCELLHEQNYQTDSVGNGLDGYEYAMTGYYDVMILDVMLPGANGYEVVTRLRKEKAAIPILMLTAKDEVTDKIRGLDAGADDYLTKPFVPEELMARIRALSRRQGEVIIEKMEYGDVLLNLDSHTLSCGEKSISLGLKEYEMMRMLFANPTVIVTKEDIIINVWGADADVVENNVEVYISFLRKKLHFLKSKVGIATVRKVGYTLCKEEKV